MRYSHHLVNEYLDGVVSRDSLLDWLLRLGYNPAVVGEAGGDTLFELETPANRVDLLSLIGVARELLPASGRKLRLPAADAPATIPDTVPVEIADPADCPYYACRVVRGVRLAPSPADLAARIEKLGFRATNNAVDISNYVMAETGQPLHMFDLGRVRERIAVRRARPGEKIRSLDARDRTLTAANLLITDAAGPVAIAGIMGGADSEVGPGTTAILIESAAFTPATIRRSGKNLGLASEASKRFEKGLDVPRVRAALDRATHLVLALCGGQAGPVGDAGSPAQEPPPLDLDLRAIAAILGTPVPDAFVARLLRSLGFAVTRRNGRRLLVTPPTHRGDVREDVDLVEEIARHWGYEKIPVDLPAGPLEPTPSAGVFEQEERLKDVAARLGFSEVVGSSLLSDTLAEGLALEAPALVNPLSNAMKYLRPSLVPGLLENARLNLAFQAERFRTFEIGRVYRSADPGYAEETRLALLTLDADGPLDLKGAVESLLAAAGAGPLEWKTEDRPLAAAGAALSLYCAGTLIGWLFVPSEHAGRVLDLRADRIVVAEILLDRCGPLFPVRMFRDLPRFPSSRRDLSLVFDARVAWPAVEEAIRAEQLPVEEIEVFDTYRGANIPAGRVSVSFSLTFRLADRTLRAEEVDTYTARVLAVLQERFGAIIRS